MKSFFRFVIIVGMILLLIGTLSACTGIVTEEGSISVNTITQIGKVSFTWGLLLFIIGIVFWSNQMKAENKKKLYTGTAIPPRVPGTSTQRQEPRKQVL